MFMFCFFVWFFVADAVHLERRRRLFAEGDEEEEEEEEEDEDEAEGEAKDEDKTAGGEEEVENVLSGEGGLEHEGLRGGDEVQGEEGRVRGGMLGMLEHHKALHEQKLRRQLRRIKHTGCNWAMYLMLYPDLRQAKNITSERAAENHYDREGRAEGRECNFDWRTYKLLNPDLEAAGLTTKNQLVHHYVTAGRNENRQYKTPSDFNWIIYLENNNDLYKVGVSEQAAAVSHYINFGKNEKRNKDIIAPNQGSWHSAMGKVEAYLKATEVKSVQQKRNLVVYHVEDIGMNDNSFDLTVNNVKTFVASVLHHHRNDSADQSAFYIFNVAAILDNPLTPIIPCNLENVALVEWVYSSSPINSFLQTLAYMHKNVVSSFNAVFHLSSGVRGPLVQWRHGEWLGEFRTLLDANNVGLVGPVLDCGGERHHVKTHVFALRPALVASVVQDIPSYYKIPLYVPMEEYFMERLSVVVEEAGYKLASLLHARRIKMNYFDGTCIDYLQPSVPEEYCSVRPQEAIFLRWSGEALGAKGFICGKGISMHDKKRALVEELSLSSTEALPQVSNPAMKSYFVDNSNDCSASHVVSREALQLVPHEALSGWILYEQYSKETALLSDYMEARAAALASTPDAAVTTASSASSSSSAVTTALSPPHSSARSVHLTENSQVCILIDVDTDPNEVGSVKVFVGKNYVYDIKATVRCKSSGLFVLFCFVCFLLLYGWFFFTVFILLCHVFPP
jgi:hypothetical protein